MLQEYLGKGIAVSIVEAGAEVIFVIRNEEKLKAVMGALRRRWPKTISNEVAYYGITVNNVLPGYARTIRLESLFD